MTPGSGYFFPQDAAITELSITSSTGKNYDISYLMVDMSLFEDIYSFVMSGYVKLKDGVGLIEGLNLMGNELITITFGKTKNYQNNPLIFRLYSIPKRDPVGNHYLEFITLYFCSEELVLSEQTKMTKSPRWKRMLLFCHCLKNSQTLILIRMGCWMQRSF